MPDQQAFNLSDLMADLQDDGVRDSTGVFTLDPQEAERKLATFALARPQDYVLKLIQAAVANGASQITVQARTGEVEICWDGPSLNREALPGLMGHLLSSHCPAETRHLRHLAAGLRGSVGVRPFSLWVESGTGAGGFRRSWSKEGWQETSRPDRGEALTVLHLGRDLGSIFSEWTSELGAMVRGQNNKNDEEEAVHSCCGYLPITLVVNNEIVPRRPFGQPRFANYQISEDEFPGECRPPKYVLSQDPESFVEGKLHKRHHLIEREVLDPAGSLPRLGQRHSSCRLSQDEPGERCRAWIALESELSPRARLEYVDEGVLLFSEELELGLPGLVCVLSVENLSKDLTGFQVVRDKSYHELLEWVRAQGQELRQELLQRLEDIPIRDFVQRAL